MKNIFIVFIAALLSISCGSTQVEYDYDTQADFSQFKTYNYLPDMQSGYNQLDQERLVQAINKEMNAKGFALSENPDILINIMSSRYEEAPNNSVGVGIGGGSRNVGVSMGTGIALGGSKIHHTLTVDVVDASKDALIWQAVGDSNLKLRTQPDERKAYFEKVVQKIFEGFPPKK